MSDTRFSSSPSSRSRASWSTGSSAAAWAAAFVTVVGCGLPIVAFALAVKCFLDLTARWSAARRRRLHVGGVRRTRLRGRLPVRPPRGRDDADRDRRGLADPRLLHRLHEGRPGLRALFRVPQRVPVLHAAAGARQVAAHPVRRLGGRRPRVVPPDRLLVRGHGQGARRQEGLHHQPRRRRRLPARHVPALPGGRHARHGGHQRRVRAASRRPRCPRASSASCCSSAPAASRRRSRCTCGCPTRWPARRRSPR